MREGPDGKHEKRIEGQPLLPSDRSGLRPGLTWALAHRGLVAGVAVLILLSSVPLFMIANKNFLPERRPVGVRGRSPRARGDEHRRDGDHRQSDRDAGPALPEVDYTLVTIADDPAQTQNSGTIYVRLKPLEDRKRDQFAVMDAVRDEVMPQFASANLRTGVRPVATFGGGGNQNAEIQFTISGPDLKALEKFAGTVAEAAHKEPGVVDVDTSLNVGKPELSVHLDRLKAADLGVSKSPTPPRRCGCWSAETRSPRTMKVASSTRCTCARSGATGRRRRRADDGAVDDARQRAAREHRALARRARRRPRSTG